MRRLWAGERWARVGRSAPVRLVRAWVAIVADLSPLARTLLLLLWAATSTMYALGLASLLVVPRLTPATVEPTRPAAAAPIAPAERPPAGPTAAPSESPTAPAVAAAAPPPAPAAPPTAPIVRGVLPSVPTLEPTPTQYAPPPPTPTAPPPTAAPAPTRAPPTSTPARRPPAPVGPAAPVAPAGPAAGTLLPRGSFAKTEFAYPGDRSVYTINLQIEPDDPGLLKNAGFVVYGPAGEEVVRGGAQPGMRPNVSANVIASKAGRYVVQVQNYDPGRAVKYSLEVVAGRPAG